MTEVETAICLLALSALVILAGGWLLLRLG